MININFDLMILLQRIMELLALYLILANLNDKSLKEAFSCLITDKQRILSENVIVFISYVVISMAIVGEAEHFGYPVIHITQPFVALFLVKVFDIKQGLLGIFFLVVSAGSVVGIMNWFISIHVTLRFGLVLAMTVWVAHKNYFSKIYDFLISKKLWLYLTCFIAIAIYVLPLSSDLDRLPFIVLLLMICLSLSALTTRGREKELSKMVTSISNSSYDELLLLLEGWSHDHNQSDTLQHFIINDRMPSTQFITAITHKLEEYKHSGIIQDGECHFIEGQIKISMIQSGHTDF